MTHHHCKRRRHHGDDDGCDSGACAAVAAGVLAAGVLVNYAAKVRPYAGPPDITGIYRIEDYRQVDSTPDSATTQTCAPVIAPDVLKVVIVPIALQDACRAGVRVDLVDGQNEVVLSQNGVWNFVPGKNPLTPSWELRLSSVQLVEGESPKQGTGRIQIGYRIAGVGRVQRLFWYLQQWNAEGVRDDRSANLNRIADAPPQ